VEGEGVCVTKELQNGVLDGKALDPSKFVVMRQNAE
jgi:hypothetical protein